jgi:4'-phosphopantetheinyl transferase
MPIIFQQSPHAHLQVAVWQISEPLSFFEQRVLSDRTIDHPQVRARHLAARYLLMQLRPSFSLRDLVVTDSGKPLVADRSFDFSLTHCADHAAAIVSTAGSVGVDLEQSGDRIFRIRHKFLSDEDQACLQSSAGLTQLQEGAAAAQWLTRCWSAKESVYKWQGQSGIDFREQIRIEKIDLTENTISLFFTPTAQLVQVGYCSVEKMELTWTI